MPQLTIAQLVASISADTSAFDSRIAKVEEQLKKTQGVAEKAAEGISKSFSSSAKGVDDVSKAALNAQKAIDNLAKYEYTIGQKSANDYANFLRRRYANLQEHSTAAKSVLSQLAAVEVKMARETAAEKNAIIRQEAQFQKEWNKVLSDDAKATSIIRIKAEKDVAEAQRESAKVAQEAARQFQTSNQEKLKSSANLARVEYQMGAKSAEEYAFFLEQRMAAYHVYSAEWKSAASEKLAVERGMAAESKAIEDERDAAILAREKQLGAERVALEKEVNAEMTAWNKEYVAGFVAQMDEAALAAEASAKRTKSIRSGAMNVGGTGVAAITAVELGSAVISQQFNHEITGQANNTLMTDAEVAKMKSNVIELGKSTGQNLQDLAIGSRWVSDFSKSTDTAAGKLNQLTWANKEAVGTLANTSDVARSLASTMYIFGARTNEAAGYIDVLHHASAAGAMTVQQFATDAGPALAVAAEMHDKFYDAAAAMSSLTKAGFNSSEAATQIKSLYAHIGEPADKATKQIVALDKAFHKLNPKSDINLKFDFSQPGIQLKGIVGLLKDIETVTGGRADLIAKIIPALRGGIGGTSLAQALGIKGNDIEKLKEVLKSLQMSNTGSESNAIFNRMAADGQQQFKKLAIEIETDFIPIGEKAMKIFEKWIPLISKTADVVVYLMESFQKLPEIIQQIITALGGFVILVKLGVDFARMFGATATMTSAFKFLFKSISSSDGIVQAFKLASGGAGTLGEALAACSVGPAAPIIVMTAAIAALAYGLYLLNQAQDNAVASANRLASAQLQVASLGPLGKINAQRSRNMAESSDIEDALQKGNQGSLGKFLFGSYSGGGTAQSLQDKGYDTNKLGFRSIEELKARDEKLKADALIMTKQLHSLHLQGVKDSTNLIAPASPFGGNGLHVIPGGAKSVTPQMLEAQSAKEAADKKAAKAAETAAKALESKYESEVRSLQKIITLKGISSDLDNKHTNRDKVLFDVSSKGDLSGISGGRKMQLEQLAKQADLVEQQRKIDLLIRKMQEKAIIAQQSPLKQEAIASFNGLDNWRSLSPGKANSVLNTQLETDRSESEAKNTKRLQELAFYQEIAGDKVKKAAVEAEGGSVKWKQLSDAQKNSRLEAERNNNIIEETTALQLEWGKAVGDSVVEIKTAMDKAYDQIATVRQENRVSDNDHSYDDRFKKITNGASIVDANNVFNSTADIVKKQQLDQDIFDRDNKKSLTFDPRQEAYAQFDKDHSNEIEKLNLLEKAYRKVEKARMDAARVQFGDNAVSNYVTTNTRELQRQTDSITSQTGFATINANSSYNTPGDKAVAEWVNSDAGQKMIAALGVLSDVVVEHEAAIKANTNIEQKIAQGLERRQQIINGVTDGIFSGVMSGLNPNPQQRGDYQSKLLSQQQEMEQYRVAQAEFKSKYPNDPNDPYVKRLKDLQKAIDETNTKLSAMGHNIGATFKRVFDSMAESFEQTLAKMAQDYLKSQLLEYITRQVGTGAGFAEGGGGGGFIGGVVSVLGSILGASGGGGKGTVPDAITAGVGPIEALKFGDGGNFKSGAPFWAGERGKPELIVPDYNGSVIPAAKISRGSSGGSGTVVYSTVNNMTVNTPDVRGFQSSRATIMQEYSRNMAARR